MTDLEDLEALEHRAKEQSKDKPSRATALAKLGRHRVRFGYATAGLRDALRACGVDLDENMHEGPQFRAALRKAIDSKQTSESADPAVLASTAEALRVYARDVQLSRTLDDQLESTIDASVKCFDKAIALLEAAEKSHGSAPSREGRRQLAWLYAHRAAALMMIYWLKLVSKSPAEGDDELFTKCRDGFDAAIRLMVPEQYAWAVQFEAFLFALRGQPGDFEMAQELLGCLADHAEQPTIQRSIAMLNSYTAAEPDNPEPKRLDAARAGQSAAMRAQQADQDEFLGPYSGAACSWAAYDIQRKTASDEEQKAMRAGVLTMIETADIRARNAVSQALVALLGLAALKAKLASDAGDPAGVSVAMGEADELAKFIEKSRFRDIESRAMVLRDPVWRALRRDVEYWKGCPVDYDALRTFKKPPADNKQAF
jgi:hypothetical protein